MCEMRPRRGPVQLSADCERIQDADEEVFILYSEKQLNSDSNVAASFRGLGYVDSHKDILEIKFELPVALTEDATSRSGNKRRKGRIAKEGLNKVIEIDLHQDKTALRSRKGDTGSVLWKASIDFAQLVLQQHYSNSSESLLSKNALADAHVFELGAGTGLLSIALSPLVRHYTVSDIGPLVPLIKKNVALNFSAQNSTNKVSVEELDWIALESALPAQKKRLHNPDDHPVDLLLAVDCLYHPSLIPPFVSTLDHLAIPERTAVLVVSELRAEDVMREFLELWLSKPGWEIWRIPNDGIGKHYVIWLGWKS